MPGRGVSSHSESRRDSMFIDRLDKTLLNSFRSAMLVARRFLLEHSAPKELYLIRWRFSINMRLPRAGLFKHEV